MRMRTRRMFQPLDLAQQSCLHAGGIYQGGAAEPEAGAAAGAGGGEADTGGAAGHRPISGNGGPGANFCLCKLY